MFKLGQKARVIKIDPNKYVERNGYKVGDIVTVYSVSDGDIITFTDNKKLDKLVLWWMPADCFQSVDNIQDHHPTWF